MNKYLIYLMTYNIHDIYNLVICFISIKSLKNKGMDRTWISQTVPEPEKSQEERIKPSYLVLAMLLVIYK